MEHQSITEHHTHTFTPRGNLEASVHVLAWLWKVDEKKNQKTPKKLCTKGEHAEHYNGINLGLELNQGLWNHEAKTQPFALPCKQTYLLIDLFVCWIVCLLRHYTFFTEPGTLKLWGNSTTLCIAVQTNLFTDWFVCLLLYDIIHSLYTIIKQHYITLYFQMFNDSEFYLNWLEIVFLFVGDVNKLSQLLILADTMS